MIMNEYAFLVMTGTIEAELESRAAEDRLIRLARLAAKERGDTDEPVRAGTTTEVFAAEDRDAAMPKERIGAGACYC